MITLTHQFQSAKADGPDSTQVQPSNWNAQHVLNMATARIIGRTTAGAGPAEEISVHSSLMLSAGVLALATNPTVAGNLIVSGTLAVGGTSQFLGGMTVTGAGQFSGSLTVTGAVGVGGAAAASAAFDVQSTTKGFLFPRMTTTQRDAIVSPATGLVIYNTTTARMEVYISGTWGPVAPLTVLTYASQAEAEAGLDDTKLMTPLRTKQANDEFRDANAIGWGQTYQDMTASRAYNTSYQNTTGRPIQFAGRATNVTTRAETFEVSSDNSTWLTINEIPSANYAIGRLAGTGQIIPNGWYYRLLLISGTAPSFQWYELR